jgi:predicted nuclease of restriction endonuclease-like RecB superfamily
VLLGMPTELRARAVEIARALVEIVELHVGGSREELEEALAAVEAGVREQRIKDGLAKLVDDRCTWGMAEELPPAAVRREVFTRAAAARRSLEAVRGIDRAGILADAARALGTDLARVEGALFADLKGAQLLQSFESVSAETLVLGYEHRQAQAVLLRAVRVTVTVSSASAGATRALFRRLKFLQLLFEISPTGEGHRIVIDGPLSLFESVTKYGQKLALVLPALEACDAWKLEADVRWGKDRTPLVFRLEGARGTGKVEEAPLPDEVAALVRGFERLGGPWRVAQSRAILDLPGQGLCVPDLVFTQGDDSIYFEAMGYWSREAVFRRIDLVERGLTERILFAVSARLRVSEELLGDRPSAALYVYKGTMSARAVAERLDELARGRAR